jgi:hypothetical protein
MVYYGKSLPIFINSSAGKNLSNDGSKFTVFFNPPIRIPGDSEPTISCNQFNCWWTFPNINSTNNQLVVSFSNVNSDTPITLTFEPGLYSLEGLNQSIGYMLNDNDNLSGSEIKFISDASTQKIIISCLPTSATGDITIHLSNEMSTIKPFLGITSDVDFTASIGGQTEFKADLSGKFNILSYIVLNSSISNGAYSPNGLFNGAEIAAITPHNVEVGSQVVWEGVNPLKVGCNLAGNTTSQATFYITDQDGTTLNTTNEEFSARLVIEY